MMKIVKSLSIIMAVVAVVAGGTYAWQLQKETISGITYSAGSMDLKIDSNPLPGEVNWVNSFNAPAMFDMSGLEPGQSGEQIIDILSEGDKDATASIKFALTANDENSLISPETEVGDTYIPDSIWDGELAQNMKVKISYSPFNDNNFGSVIYDKTLAEYHADSALLNLGKITSSTGIASVKLEWYIPADASNQIMTDSVGINIIFGLE